MTETNQNEATQATPTPATSGTQNAASSAAPADAGTAAIQCNSILGFNRIVRMGFNTFFLPKVGLFDTEFISRVYPGVYSINGIRMNPETIRERYKTFGIYRRQFINSQRMIINFDIVRSCNGSEYEGLSNFEVTQKLFRVGICSDPIIDSIPEQKCGEANDSFDILDYDLLDDCSESNENIFTNSCNNSYNFFLDLFNWRYVAFCNRNMVKSGYTGCIGVTEWYITEGIYEGVPFNEDGDFIDLDFVACANDLTELRTYREVVCFIMQFGICDDQILLAVPEVESCAARQLNAFNFARTSRIVRVLNEFLRTHCVSAEGANNIATCGRGRRRKGIRFPPDELINRGSYQTSSTLIENTNLVGNYTGTNNNLGNSTAIRNYGFFNPPPTSTVVETSTLSNSGCCGNTNYTAANTAFTNTTPSCGLSFPSAASRNRYDSQNERFKVRAEQNIIRQQLYPCETAPTASTTSALIDNSVPVPSKCKCGAIFDSYATPNGPAGSNLPRTCPNCIRQYNAYQNINTNIGYITPLTLTTQPFNIPINGTTSNSVLVNSSNGNFNTTAGISGLINANNGVGGGLFGGGCCNKSIAQPYYDNGTGTNFRSPYRSAYFS